MLILITRLLTFLLLLVFIFKFYHATVRKEKIDFDSALVDRSPSMFIEYGSEASIDRTKELISILNISENRINAHSKNVSAYPLVISDFQGITIEDLNLVTSDSTINRSFIVTGNITEYKNAFVDSLAVNFNPNDFSQLRITFFPNVSSSLNDGNLIYRLIHGERQLSSVVEKADDQSKIGFDIPIELRGEFKIEIEGDEVFYDNQFRFVISERTKPKISIVSDENNIFLKQIFANTDLFVVNYLESSSLNFEVLRKSDLIILNGSELPTGVTSEFANKTVITFLPANKTSKDFDLSWMDLSVKVSNDTSSSEIILDYDNPFLSGIFSEKSDDSSLPFVSSSLKINGNYEVIIPLRNGEPFLSRASNGLHYLFNVSLDLNSTNFPTHSIFLPLLYKIALSTTSQKAESYYCYPGDLGFIDGLFLEVPPKIINENLEIIPEFNPADNGISFQVPQLDPGFYQLLYNQDTFQVAVNMAREESLMQGVTLRELEENYGHLDHVSVQSASASNIAGTDDKSELWKYALILIISILLIETLFHKYLR